MEKTPISCVRIRRDIIPQRSLSLNPNSNISLGILAGGKGQRWGGRDKGLIPVNGQLLVAGIVQVFEAHVAEVIINCRRHPHVYQQYCQRIVGDAVRSAGPAAGIAALLSSCQTPLLLVMPCDIVTPSSTLLNQMVNALTPADKGAFIIDNGGKHSACALLRRGLSEPSWSYIASGRRSLTGLFEHLQLKAVINQPLRDIDDYSELRAMIQPLASTI